MKKVKKLVSVIKEIDKENDFEIAFSDIVHREDRGCTGMIDDTNKKLKCYCGFFGIVNIDGTLEANYI